MTKVAFLVSSLNVGGIEKYLLRYLRSQGKDINCTVICKREAGGALEDEVRALGVRIWYFSLPSRPSFSYLHLYRTLRVEKFDAVCDFTGDFAAIPMIASALAGVPVRISFYRGSAHQFKVTPIRILYVRWLSWAVRRFSSRVLSNSEAALDKFQPGWRTRLRQFVVVRNGIERAAPMTADARVSLRRRLGVPEDAFVVGHVGRFVAAKNHSAIAATIRLTLAQDSTVWFLLIGAGVKRGMQELLEKNGVRERVLLLDAQDEIAAFLQCMDLFYFPSLNEGMPNALLEAASYGLPLLVSDIPSIREVVMEGPGVTFVDPCDSLSAARSILRQLRSPEAETCLWLAQQVSERFGSEENYKRLTDELMAQRTSEEGRK